MTPDTDINSAVQALRQGGVIAYPTESVYGLGCDPFNAEAVFRLLTIKKRPVEKGLILVASDWSQIEMLIQPLSPHVRTHLQETWPGPVTWLVPASELTPHWIQGNHDRVALRISAHPIVKQLCDKFCGPIVSTSANISGNPPTRDYRGTCMIFKKLIDYIVSGKTTGLQRPTQIRDAITNNIIRS